MKYQLRGVITIMAVLLALFFIFNQSEAYAAGPDLALYNIKIENLTTGQPFSPQIAATHGGTTRMFRVGGTASAELAALAEEGNITPLANLFGRSNATTRVVSLTAPLAPGTSVNFEIQAGSKDRLSLALGLSCTNDGFAGLNRVALPLTGFKVFDLDAHDAGTEENSNQSGDISDLCTGQPADGNAGTPTNPPQPVQIHPGVPGGTNPVARVTVTRLTDTTRLRTAVTVTGIRRHQRQWQEIANNNNGTRLAGTPGYDRSAEYVFNKLQAAGYEVRFQEFDFPFFQELAEPVLEQTAPNQVVYPPNDPAGFFTLQFSGSGDVTALVQPTTDVIVPMPPDAPPSTSNSGCEGAFIEDELGNLIPNTTGVNDFAGFVAGNIALVQRGTCFFATKAVNAEAAGAVGVIIFNEGQPGRTDGFGGTLGGPVVTIPVVGASYAIGEALFNLDQAGDVTVHISTSTLSEIRPTRNVLADTKEGNGDRIVVVGAHLDSVAEGPGIQDNGSGSGTILEIALQMARLGIKPLNKVRFAFWGAEEEGLIGSQFYVDNLSEEQLGKHLLNLNFDMIASPNFARFVYDGDGSDTPDAGPPGSENIEKIFVDYFAAQGLFNEPTAFDGRSDYGPFIAVGIPAGGLFTGAEGIKTEEQAAIYGGTAGVAYDPCYHLACDTFANNNNQALREMSDATAHAVLTFAFSEHSVSDTIGVSSANAKKMEYKGSHLQR